MNDRDLLALHRALVGIPSVSHQEGAIAAFALEHLERSGLRASRYGDNVFAAFGEGPTLCFNTHLDTVPPAAGWSRPPHDAYVSAGRVYGLGSNDAKASAAAMIAAFLRLRERRTRGFRCVLTLVAEEETGGKGSEALVPFLSEQGIDLQAVIVGEPTGLDVAIAQKGLLVLELAAQGRACHAAHAHALGAANPIRALARDLVALERFDPGPPHPDLGPVTWEPTVLQGASARNMVPAEATCILDVRTNPVPPVDSIVATLQSLVEGEIRVRSQRLRPCEIDREDPLVRAALQARPQSRLIGSRGVSDLVFFRDIPGIKVGPGATERSHTADEWVGEHEVVEGAKFYEQAALSWASLVAGGGTP